MITGTLKTQVDNIWETYWNNGISSPMTVIEQFSYMLFIKRLDDMQLEKEKKAMITGEAIRKPVYTPEEKILRWSNFKLVTSPKEVYQLFTVPQETANKQTVFSHMKNIGDEGGVFAEFVEHATLEIKGENAPAILDQVIKKIDKLDLSDKDLLGDLYEYMLSKLSAAGTLGQFRTPRHIIKMMVEMTEPQKEDTICDPSTGTAGFLVAVNDYMEKKHADWFADDAFLAHHDKDMFSGLEFDSTMARIGAMNLQMHGISHPRLERKDALSKTNEIRDRYSLILANPPFKGSLNNETVEPYLLKKTNKSKKTELLFLALMLRMMKTGGRAAVIVPDGVLFGSSKAHKDIRKEIIENHKLDAVVSMPSGVFKPYAGVSTAVLFFTKTNSGGTDNVWFYDMKADGFSLDDKRNPVEESDIADIIQRYTHLDGEADRKRTDQSFMVPFEEIKENDWDLSINRYKEIVYEEVQYDAPQVIIDRIKELDKARREAMVELEKMLG